MSGWACHACILIPVVIGCGGAVELASHFVLVKLCTTNASIALDLVIIEGTACAVYWALHALLGNCVKVLI